MQNRYLILNILSDGEFHSGEDMGKALELSRAAIWKHLQALLKSGIEVQSVRGRGYRLEKPIELLDEGLIRSRLDNNANTTISRLEIHPELDSTNYYLRSIAQQEKTSGHVCIAEHQSKGVGTRGRQWISPFGSNVYLSLYWKFDCGPATLGGLSLAVAVAVARAIEEIGVIGVELKWPNDIVFRNQKLGGILLEMSGDAYGPCNVVIGIGLNISMSAASGAVIDQPWTDLKSVAPDKNISRNLIASNILNQLILVVQEFQNSGFEPFLKEWQLKDGIRGKSVKLLLSDNEQFGVVKGIDKYGALLLETENGIQCYSSGEVSMRLQS